jgi:hypothetical protein
LGIVHVVLWTPLVVYLWGRAKNGEITLPFRLVIWLFVATLVVSLAFDYIDVARYLLGERDSMIQAASSPGCEGILLCMNCYPTSLNGLCRFLAIP